MSDLKPGDIVRVKDPNGFVSALAKKIENRDAIVNWVGPDRHGQFKGYVKVTFQKRNGRGKEFSERLHIRDLVRVSPSLDEVTGAGKGEEA